MNPNEDRRRTHVNAAEWDTTCHSCGGRVRVSFAVRNRCNKCLFEMIESLQEVRRNKPSRVQVVSSYQVGWRS